MKVVHELKCHPKYFERVLNGSKPFEIRKNDRDFQVGDVILLKEYDPEHGWPDHGSYNTIEKRITYITDYMQKHNYVVLGLEDCDDK